MGPQRRKESRSKKVIEPIINLFEDGNYLRVIAELPDIAEEKVSIDPEKRLSRSLQSIQNPGKTYKKINTLPCEVQLDKKTFHNGILDLRLEKNNCEYR